MKRITAGLLLFIAGCSTRPFVDFLDFAFPARKPGGGVYYGGVGPPQPLVQQPGAPFLQEPVPAQPPAVSGPVPPPPPVDPVPAPPPPPPGG